MPRCRLDPNCCGPGEGALARSVSCGSLADILSAPPSPTAYELEQRVLLLEKQKMERCRMKKYMHGLDARVEKIEDVAIGRHARVTKLGLRVDNIYDGAYSPEMESWVDVLIHKRLREYEELEVKRARVE